MDQPQVDEVDAERLEARLDGLPLAARLVRRQLGRDENLGAVHSTVVQGLADLGLVAIPGGRVDVPVADVQRRAGGLVRRLPGDLPRAETDHRQRHPGGQFDGWDLMCHAPILPDTGDACVSPWLVGVAW